jgi:hypothetical protein
MRAAWSLMRLFVLRFFTREGENVGQEGFDALGPSGFPAAY